MKGKIIVIEGTDCSGKETQSKLLENKLIEIGLKCIRFEFPNYDSPTGKIVGGAYLGKEEISKSLFAEGAPNVDPYIACLYYAADLCIRNECTCFVIIKRNLFVHHHLLLF